jgi:pyruvate formate lyase activating enzyme
MSGATLQPVLNTLKTLRERNVWLEITHLMIPTTETAEEFRAMCRWLRDNGFADTPLHLTRFFPRYQLQKDYAPTPIATLHQAKAIAQEEGIRHIHLGNVPSSDE